MNNINSRIIAEIVMECLNELALEKLQPDSNEISFDSTSFKFGLDINKYKMLLGVY